MSIRRAFERIGEPLAEHAFKTMREEQWSQLIALKPRYAGVVTAIRNGDNTLYLLSKKFGTFSVHKIIKELLEMGVIRIASEEKTGRPKKIYALTSLGEKLRAGAVKSSVV